VGGDRRTLRVGVLALQGGVVEHVLMLRRLGAETVEVRIPCQMKGLDALVIPGGESTTIGKLVVRFELLESLRTFAAQKPVWGTCAGMILLARDIGKEEPLIGLMDICVERNAFGRQKDSFTAALPVPGLEQGTERPFPAVFIRAPIIRRTRGEARELARLSDGTMVAAREGRWLATSFHPELTGDDRFHRYFLEMVREAVDLP
jgi:5'-phosphate synthase pdxT subunit